ncbi:hypothetical protein [Persephonella sp. KM09-Lau-8]|uniref:hypothetical protein n=1 Tax=Persephonella sp. KM09-Lau-8 TaxID=1158345 RepID=UPI000495CB6F|nr:hypothetical protein [Persephonella sp. KM09-Lau-8]
MRHWKTGLAAMFLLGISSIFYSCWDSDDSGSSSSSEPLVTISETGKGYAMLGNLAGATVEIFKLNSDGTIKLVATEETSDGNTLDEIGLFNTHYNELEDNSLYIYQVKGGCDWDADDDGIKDNQCTPNNGVIRALVTGEEVKNLKDSKLIISYLTELQYKFVVKYLKNYLHDGDGLNIDEINNILKIRDEIILDLIKTDLNKDGKINEIDILSFKPARDKETLSESVKKDMDSIISSIRDNEFPDITKISCLYNEDRNYGFDLTAIGIEPPVMLIQKMDYEDSQYIYLLKYTLDLPNIVPQYIYKLDISNINDLKVVGSYNLENIGSDGNNNSLKDILVSNGEIYIIIGGVPYIINMSDNSILELPILENDEIATYIRVFDSIAVLKIHTSTGNRIKVVDLSNNQILDEFEEPDGTTNVAFYRGKLYITSHFGIYTKSVGENSSYERLYEDENIDCIDIAAKDNYIYALCQDEEYKLYIFEASDSNQPIGNVTLFSEESGGFILDSNMITRIKKISNNFVYLTLNGKVNVVNIVDKSHPYVSYVSFTEETPFTLMGNMGLIMIGNYLISGDSEFSDRDPQNNSAVLYISQLEFPENPHVVYNIDDSYFSGNMYKKDNTLYFFLYPMNGTARIKEIDLVEKFPKLANLSEFCSMLYSDRFNNNMSKMLVDIVSLDSSEKKVVHVFGRYLYSYICDDEGTGDWIEYKGVLKEDSNRSDLTNVYDMYVFNSSFNVNNEYSTEIYIAGERGFYKARAVTTYDSNQDKYYIDVNIETNLQIGKPCKLFINKENTYAYVLSKSVTNKYLYIIPLDDASLNNLQNREVRCDGNLEIPCLLVENNADTDDIGIADLIKDGDYIYVLTESGLKIIDVSIPENSQIIGQFNGEFSKIAKEGDILYLLTASHGCYSIECGFEEFTQIVIMDVSNPGNPQKIKNISISARIVDIKLYNGKIYASSDKGMFIIDPYIDDPLKAE